ncbi:MAG TPA: helix-turn-helix domain-containing protein [Polyangia bacterium]|nr:helix-turn-helix domain-containing protein [Polyangia bacterium]
MTLNVDQISPTRRALLGEFKQHGPSTIAELAERLEMSGEAIRQQLVQLQREGWVEAIIDRAPAARADASAGRPPARFRLTASGDHLFPKHYDALAVMLLDTVAAELGKPAFEKVLAAVAEARVRAWEPRTRGLSLPERVQALKAVYGDGDPYMEVEKVRGGFRLIERNCPFLNVAMQRPALCSVTVSALSRLLGVRVVREERFQHGHGRCVFRISSGEPADPKQGFALEPDAPAEGAK